MQDSIPSSPLEEHQMGLMDDAHADILCSGREGRGKLVCCKVSDSSSVLAPMKLFPSGISHCKGRRTRLWTPSAKPACFPEGKNLFFYTCHIQDPRSLHPSVSSWNELECRLGALWGDLVIALGVSPFWISPYFTL